MRNGIGFVYFQNDEVEYEISASVKMNKSENIEIIYPEYVLEMSLHMGSMQSKVIVFVANKLPYSVSTHFSFSCKKEIKEKLNLMKQSVKNGNFRKKSKNDGNMFSVSPSRNPKTPKNNRKRSSSKNENGTHSEMIFFKNYNIYLLKSYSDEYIVFIYENKSINTYNVKVTFDIINGFIKDEFSNSVNFF